MDDSQSEKPAQSNTGGASLWGAVSRIPGKLLGIALLVLLVFVFVICFVAVMRGQPVALGPLKISPPKNRVYVVKGKVVTSDHGPTYDVQVMIQFPPKPLKSDGSLQGIQVWRDPNGLLPTIGVQSTDYRAEPIDLNLFPPRENEGNTPTIDIGDIPIQPLP